MTKTRIPLFLIFIPMILWCCTEQNRKLKSKKVYGYYYNMGTISKEGRLNSEIRYDMNEKVIEEVEYGRNDSISIKTIYRYNSEGKLTEEANYSDGRLFQKKLISYNNSGLEDVVEVYQEDQVPMVRGAWLTIFYNNDNKVIEKKWLGNINQEGEYSEFLHTARLINGREEIVNQMPDISKEDTTIARYFYNERNKLIRIEIGKMDNAEQVFQKSDSVNYKYNNSDSLILVKKSVSGLALLFRDLASLSSDDRTEFIYKDGKLVEIIESDQIKIIDKMNNVTEKITYDRDKLQLERFTYRYDEQAKLIEITEFNNANEPTRQNKVIYEYQ